MDSASIIRTFSKILMIISILAIVIWGIVLFAKSDEERLYMSLLIWFVGIFIAVFINALFAGFADLIDNTGSTAHNIFRIGSKNPKAFQAQLSSVNGKTPVDSDRQKKAQELFAKGLINQSEYDEMIAPGKKKS